MGKKFFECFLFLYYILRKVRFRDSDKQNGRQCGVQRLKICMSTDFRIQRKGNIGQI